eukprot:scaffold2616_cov41-Tisochrysis_lutea.AAC.2
MIAPRFAVARCSMVSAPFIGVMASRLFSRRSRASRHPRPGDDESKRSQVLFVRLRRRCFGRVSFVGISAIGMRM